MSDRHAKANSEYTGTEFDPAEESKFISYLVANNLYGRAMSKQHPTSGFTWMADNELGDWKQLSCFLVVVLNILKIYTAFAMIIPLLRNALRLEMSIN